MNHWTRRQDLRFENLVSHFQPSPSPSPPAAALLLVRGAHMGLWQMMRMEMADRMTMSGTISRVKLSSGGDELAANLSGRGRQESLFVCEERRLL
jgi:hypothetical protein